MSVGPNTAESLCLYSLILMKGTLVEVCYVSAWKYKH